MTNTGPKLDRRTFAKTAAAAAAITGFPYISRAQGKVIRVGTPTILSGRVAVLGQSCRTAAQIAFKAFNDAGGVNGRTLELVERDSQGRPDLAAKTARDLINNDGCEILIDGEASSGAFAVHEVARDLPVLCMHVASETSSLSADPKLAVATAFRCARQGIHDAVAGGIYTAKIAKAKGLRRWISCSPDYAYGRDNTAEYFEFAKRFEPSIEVVDQVWPKLFAPDYTESITKILQVKPQAIYSALWGGDLVAFTEQAALYNLFSSTAVFSAALGDPPVLTAIKQLPEGVLTAYRYSRTYPDNPGNTAFADAFKAVAKFDPTNWAWQTYVAAGFITEALKRTNGSTDGKRLAGEIAGMKLNTPLGVDGTITMRETDHTLIDYPLAWSRTTRKPPYLEGFDPIPWAQVLSYEAEWKKQKGYTYMQPEALLTCIGTAACVVTQISTALIVGSLLFLFASGLSLIFGVLRVINFAHGGFYMVGAYLALTAYKLTGSFLVALVAGAIGAGLFGVLFERLIISWVYGPNLLMQLLVCYAMTLILDDGVKLAFGAEYQMMGMPATFALPPVQVAGGFLPTYYLFMISMALLTGLLLWLAINRTLTGKIVRALAVNPQMVGVLGVNTTVIYAGVFGLGSLLAGLAGALAAPIRTLTPGIGLSFLIDSFIVTVIGGMGSIAGVLLAAILVGFIRAFGAIGSPWFVDGLMFAIMALVLVIKPTGLLGREAA